MEWEIDVQQVWTTHDKLWKLESWESFRFETLKLFDKKSNFLNLIQKLLEKWALHNFVQKLL